MWISQNDQCFQLSADKESESPMVPIVLTGRRRHLLCDREGRASEDGCLVEVEAEDGESGGKEQMGSR